MSKKKRKKDEDFPIRCNLCGKTITFDTALVTLDKGVPVFACEECIDKLKRKNDN